MSRRRATRLGALAGVLAVVGIVPFAQHVEAGEAEVPATEVIADGPVGVLVFGPGTDTDAPIDDPAPSDDPPPSSEPPPGNTAPPPSGSTTTPPLAAMVGAPRPPQRTAVRSNPTATALATPVASGATPATKGQGVSLEDIFLNNRATQAGLGAAASHSSRSVIEMPSSSLPSMLMTTLLVMLGGLLVTTRYYGSSLFAWPLGAARQRRRAPRGWRVVATTPPTSVATIASISDLERPVLAAVKLPATSTR